MTPQDIATWHMVFFGHRMRALEIVAQRMPKANIDVVMKEAERVLRWASTTGETESK